MDWIALVVVGIVTGIVFLFKDANAEPTILGVGPLSVDDAIMAYIVRPLGLPDEAGPILRVQSALETGNWKSNAFKKTNSLFNRHVGSGRGFWVGAGKPISSRVSGVDYYDAGAGDRDLRIYADIGQAAKDMAQLLSDGLYVSALTALRRADANGYYYALGAAGFAKDPTYAYNLSRNYAGIA